MSIAGRSPLAGLRDFDAKKKGWYTKTVNEFVDRIATEYATRCEITSGGLASTGGSVSASAMQLDLTAMEGLLGGFIMAPVAAKNDVDYFNTSGDIGQAIFQDGATAAGISLATDETAFVTVIWTNSDGSDGIVGVDNGAGLFVAVVKGAAATYEAQTAHLTTEEIRDALAASTTVHAATTKWVHICRVLWDENSASPEVTIVMNRNNGLGI